MIEAQAPILSSVEDNRFCSLVLQRQHFACFGSWVLYHTLNIMIQYLLSGFELELYSPHEYHYVFW